MNFLSKIKSHQLPKKSAVSVYVGPESIEITQLKRTMKGVSVVKAVSKNIAKKDVTSSIIKEIFEKEGIKDTAVTTTLPEESVMLRRFTMPLIPMQDRPTAVRFEAKRHIPFNIEEVTSAYHVIREDRIKSQMEILFVAAKREDVNSLITLLHNAGLTVEKIEPMNLALISTLIQSGVLKEATSPSAILHFSDKTDAQIIIAENNVPFLKREISFAGKDIKEEEQLLNEIRLSLSYYKREFPEKNITRLVICGLKEKPVWLDSIKSNLGLTPEYVLPLKKITGMEAQGPDMEIAFGLANQRLAAAKMDLNLVPEEMIPSRYHIQKIAAIEVMAAVCILGLIYLAQTPSLAKIKKEIALTESKKTPCAELALTLKSIDELNTLKTTWRERRDILSACVKNKINWYEKLKILTQIMPKEIWITQLTVGDSIGIPGVRFLILRGSVYSENSAAEIEITNNFSTALKNDSTFMNGFKRLTLGTINKTKIESYEVANFDISLTTD